MYLLDLMPFGSACYTFPPIIQKFNYNYLIADYKLTDNSLGPGAQISIDTIKDNGEFKNNLTGGIGRITSQFVLIQTPFINNNIEYENSTQELIVYGKFSYDTLPPNSNIFYFSTDSNIRNILNADILENNIIKVSYSNSNIGYYSNIINPSLELDQPPYNFIIQLYNGGSSNILDTIVLNSNNTLYNITRNFIPLHNIFDTYHKNTLSLGSPDIQLYDFRVYNKFNPVSLPLPITDLVIIPLSYCIILDTVNFKNIGINSANINIVNKPSISRVVNNDIYIFNLSPDTDYDAKIEIFDNFQNIYFTNQIITTCNYPSLTEDLINPPFTTVSEASLMSNTSNTKMYVGLDSVLYTNIVGIIGINTINSYGISLQASNIGISDSYINYTAFNANIYINSNDWNLTVNIANFVTGGFSYKPSLIVKYRIDTPIFNSIELQTFTL
jgi:hypothetical protein